MGKNLTDLIVALDQHIADMCLMLRYIATATMCVMAIAVLAQALLFAFVVGMVGLWFVWQHLTTLQALRVGRGTLTGLRDDVWTFDGDL